MALLVVVSVVAGVLAGFFVACLMREAPAASRPPIRPSLAQAEIDALEALYALPSRDTVRK
jgi:uncharacterized protein YneF (UPF0154 family)